MARFLVQCALRDDAPGTAAAEYWLRRVKSSDDGMDTLLTAAFDTAPEVRERVATLLGAYSEPLVRDRLRVLALSDAAPAVRKAAIASLGRMADDELLQQLLQEVRKPNGPYRQQAIEALRVFPRPEVATELQTIVRERRPTLHCARKRWAFLPRSTRASPWTCWSTSRSTIPTGTIERPRPLRSARRPPKP